MRHEAILKSQSLKKFKSIKNGVDPYPVVIEIHPTDVCNHGCKYCFHGGNGFGKDRDPSRYMRTVQYLSLFGEFTDLGIYNLSISGGGEPFLSKNIVDIVSGAVENGLLVRVVTTGNYLPKIAISYLMKCSEVRFSVDAVDPSTYSKIRNVPPLLLEKTLENMRMVIKSRNEAGSSLQIGTTFIINTENSGQILSFASLMLGSVGVNKIIYKYDVYGRYVPDTNSSIVKEHLEEVKKQWGEAVEIRDILSPFITGLPCVMPFFKPVINPYGDLYSCCLGSQPRETNGYYFGNLTKYIRGKENNAFQKVWTESRDIRRQMLKSVKCLSCNYTDRKINQSFLNFSQVKID